MKESHNRGWDSASIQIGWHRYVTELDVVPICPLAHTNFQAREHTSVITGCNELDTQEYGKNGMSIFQILTIMVLAN